MSNLPFLTAEDIRKDIGIEKPTFFDWANTNMPPRYYGIDFEKFPNKITEQVRDFCLNGKGVLFIEGNNGTGKTATVCASFKERYNAGMRTGSYISGKYQICPMYRSSRLFSSKISEYEFLSKYYNSPFLVIDESGKGDDKNIEKLFTSNVLGARYDYDLPTIIASNMTMKEYCTWLESDISSRLHEVATVLTLEGADFRYAK